MKKKIWGATLALILSTTAQLNATTSNWRSISENLISSSEICNNTTEVSANIQDSNWRSKLNAVTNYKFVYDENFTPSLNLDCRNPFDKTITAIEFGFDYSGYDSEDFLAPRGSVIVRIQIPSNEKRESTTRLNAREDRSLKSLWIKRVVFSDGSILN